MTGPLFVGIDVGTQGVRVVAATAAGEVVARASSVWPAEPSTSGEVHEQDPEVWWAGIVDAVTRLGMVRSGVVAMAVSCTSGTVCVLDDDGAPVMPALMYSDRRRAGPDGVDSSWALAKLHWMTEHRRETLEAASVVTSPGGYVTGRLVGRRTAVDHTQALKFGLDPVTGVWADAPVDVAMLPDVVDMDTVVGTVDDAIAEVLGLPGGVQVVAGVTDGVAAHVACGLDAGVWAVSVGSTIVFKTVSAIPVVDAQRGVYSHRGPDGLWLAGAASNAGARLLSTWASDDELDGLGARARFDEAAPVYPSAITGERFPFVDPLFAPGRSDGDAPDGDAPDGDAPDGDAPDGRPGRYAAEVLGMALVERWGCDVLRSLGCPPPAVVRATGGTSASAPFMQLRADVMGTVVEVPTEPSSAFGAAVVAAAGHHGGVVAAVDAMVSIATRYQPATDRRARWDDTYEAFRHDVLNGAVTR